VHALERRGITFESGSDAFVNHAQSQFYSLPPLPTPSAQKSPPQTPPPSTLSELQTRTFASLRKHQIVPRVDNTLRLVQCAAHHREFNEASSSSILRPALTTALLVDKPRFLSLTLTPADPAASLLLEKRLLARFLPDPTFGVPADENSSLLLGSKEDILVPIMLDLRDLPLEATGIVCGVAGRLAAATHQANPVMASGCTSPVNESKRFSFESSNVDVSQLSSSVSSIAISTTSSLKAAGTGTGGIADLVSGHARTQSKENNGATNVTPGASLHHRLEPEPADWYSDAVEISFLSTARAGTVLVGERELHRAVEALDAESRERMPDPSESLADLGEPLQSPRLV
jgi:hypothetical protein